MSEREPALLGDRSGAPAAPIAASADPEPDDIPELVRPRRESPTVYVVGFWRRAIAALADVLIIVPLGLLVTLIASKLAGVHLPTSHLKLFDIDQWIDLVIATDPALVMGMALIAGIGLIYVLVFQIALGRTLGMRLVGIKIIDVYGERPTPGRCLARCAGYLASIATLGLGFLWIGFDSEKRGLQDWIAGTYVIRARGA